MHGYYTVLYSSLSNKILDYFFRNCGPKSHTEPQQIFFNIHLLLSASLSKVLMAKMEVMQGSQSFQVLIDVSTLLLFKNGECCLPEDCSNVYFRLLHLW